MSHPTIFVGLDMHVRSIAIAVAFPDGTVRFHTTIPHEASLLLRHLERLAADPADLSVVYEAGPTGYGIARLLAARGIACTVAAPSLLPTRSGDRVKTDRRDAVKLARALRAGDVTGVMVPTEELDALRALSRHRDAVKVDLHRVRQRLLKLLHARSIVEPAHCTRWRGPWLAWLDGLTFAEAADADVMASLRREIAFLAAELTQVEVLVTARLETSAFQVFSHDVQSFHGIGPVTAAGIVTEFGDLRRFGSANQAMAYVGVVPCEHSSGEGIRRGGITRTGNRHLRWLLTEAAWHYTRPPTRRPTHPDARRAVDRLTHRYAHHRQRGKPAAVAATAIARELVGFLWGMAQTA